MPPVVRLRVVAEFPAVNGSDNRAIVKIRPGSIIETSEDLQRAGLITIRVDHQVLLAFARDIQERTETLDQSAAS